MTKINTQHTKMYKSKSELQHLFKKHIYSALESAMSIKTDDMSDKDFKNLVQFILSVKCQLI